MTQKQQLTPAPAPVCTYLCVCVCVVLFVQHGTEQKGNIDFMASYIIK